MKGQTLMELVIVVAVIAMVVGALVFATIASLRNANLAKNQAQGTKLAQEGLERARTGRDRNERITGLPDVADCPNVDSWNGDVASPIWTCKIYATCGSGGNCYLKFTSTSNNNLTYITTADGLPSGMETIPAPPDTLFYRVIILSDDSSTYSTEKKVTTIVTWKDFAGDHESRLTTILRNAIPLAPPPPPPPPPPPFKRVFVTSTTYEGNLSGLAGADRICQSRANDPDSNPATTDGLGGTWKAWLSTSSSSAFDRLTHHTIQYQRIDGTIVANNWDDLTDGLLSAPINTYEDGSTVATPYDVWTSTLRTGDSQPTYNCNSWTSSSDQRHGGTGDATKVGIQWTDDNDRLVCTRNRRLYCFEQ